MDAITGFVYGMSMMFFSMMAWMFWRKGSDRLFRLIMILMLIVDAQCLKDILSFYFTGFDNEENWFLISAADMFIIPFYSFVLMELVKPVISLGMVVRVQRAWFPASTSYRTPGSSESTFSLR